MGISQSPEGRGSSRACRCSRTSRWAPTSAKDRPEIGEDLERVYSLFPRLEGARSRRRDAVGRRAADARHGARAHGAAEAAPARRAVDGPRADLRRKIFEIVREINEQGTTILLVEQNALMALDMAAAATCSRPATSRWRTTRRRCATTSRFGRRTSARRNPAQPLRLGCVTQDADRGRAPARRRPPRDSELFLVDGTTSPTARTSRCPRSSRRARASRRTPSSASRTCSSSSSPTTGRRASRSPGTPAPPTARSSTPDTRSTAGRCRPPRRAVPAFPPDRRGLRLPEPRVRGLGGRRRHRHARRARRRGRDQDDGRLDRPRCLPARQRQRLADDDAARSRGRPRVHARAGLRPLRRHARAGPDFIGLKGDTSDNIPGVPGIGDKTAGQLVAQYGSLEGVLEHVDELAGTRGSASASTPSRRRARRSSRRCAATCSSTAIPRARPQPARPLPSQGDVQAVRVPEPAPARGRDRRGASRRRR